MNKLVPSIIIIVALALGVLVYFSLPPEQLPLGPPYDVPYEECMEDVDAFYFFYNAITTKDPSHCDGFVSKDVCLAVLNKDPSLCDEVGSCYAMIEGDITKCDEEDHFCELIVSGDVKHCEKFRPAEQAWFNQCVAIASKDDSYFSSSQVKQDCTDQAYFDFGDSVEACNKIEKKELRDLCKQPFI